MPVVQVRVGRISHELLNDFAEYGLFVKYSRPRLTVASRHVPAFDSDFCTSKIMS